MENIRHAISNTFNTKTTKVTFFAHEGYPNEDIRINVIFKTHENSSNIGKSFLKFRMKPGQPLFHSLHMESCHNLDKFNQMFQMNKRSREHFTSINELIQSFKNNEHFSRFLIFNDGIKSHEFYTFEKPAAGIYVLNMLEKNQAHGITSCVNGSYRNVALYELIKNFAVTRDKKVVIFPTLSFFNYPQPFSLYFSLADNKVYKLPADLTGLATVEDIVEASTLFSNHDIDVFTNDLLMMYINNLHNGYYKEFLDIPQENLAGKIDLLMMAAI